MIVRSMVEIIGKTAAVFLGVSFRVVREGPVAKDLSNSNRYSGAD